MYKAAIVLCAQALFIQSAFSACAGIGAGIGGQGLGGAGWAGNGLGLAGQGLGGVGWAGNGLGLAGQGLGGGCGCGGVASTGGGLPISSASLIAPVGLSVLSENVYEGTLCVNGNLPFLGTVGIQGVLPTAGAGAVSYGCGNGGIGIGAEAGPIVTGIASPNTYAPGIGAGLGGVGAGLGGIGAGLGGIRGSGCGCGGIY